MTSPSPTDAFVEYIVGRAVALLAPMVEAVQTVRPRLLTTDQAAVYLGRTLEAMRCLSKTGKVPVVRSDSRVFFDVQDLDRWIEANKQ